jgi:C4-dicarboxylate-specific signal transduction histidine kinase
LEQDWTLLRTASYFLIVSLWYSNFLFFFFLQRRRNVAKTFKLIKAIKRYYETEVLDPRHKLLKFHARSGHSSLNAK